MLLDNFKQMNARESTKNEKRGHKEASIAESTLKNNECPKSEEARYIARKRSWPSKEQVKPHLTFSNTSFSHAVNSILLFLTTIFARLL